MKRHFIRLACISLGSCVLATAAFAQTPVSPPGSWPYLITTPGSYRLTANMLAPAPSSAIVIGASNVTLDLNGFTVAQSGLVPPCSPDITTGYGSTCSAVAGNALISATGRNITIKNGTVSNGSSAGIVLNPISPGAAMGARFEDLNVTGNRGDGISATGEGNRYLRVNALYNSGIGIEAGTYAQLEDVSANWNDGNGVLAGSFGMSSRVITRANGATGFFGAGVLDHLLTSANNSSGLIFNGVVRNAASQSNGISDAVTGVLLDSNFYTGTVSVTGCYAQTAAGAFLGTGVPMTSNTCP